MRNGNITKYYPKCCQIAMISTFNKKSTSLSLRTTVITDFGCKVKIPPFQHIYVLRNDKIAKKTRKCIMIDKNPTISAHA